MKKEVKNTCKPPRFRSGASFPGGKILRKRHTRLAIRRQAFEGIKDKSGFTMPGSMK